jgi:hypothetical protein
VVAGIPFPRRRFTGVGRSRLSGLDSGQGLAQEVEHDTAKSPRHTGQLLRAWSGLTTAGSGAGSPA